MVVSPLKSWACVECAGSGHFLKMDDAGPLCLSCADLDHRGAERECLADEESRARRREREKARRAEEDSELEARAEREIPRLYPGCPRDRAEEISRHAFTRGSGRVGRTAAGRELDRGALTHAVAAAIRHVDTPYDELLMTGIDRLEARARVRPEVEQVIAGWQRPAAR